MKLSNTRMYLCLFLCSLSIFMYEILAVRVFSVLYAYSILFIMISLAVLGLGLGGIFYQWYKTRQGGLDRPGGENVPLGALILFPLSVDLSLVFITKFFSVFQLWVCTLAATLPFFFGGIIMAAVYHMRAESSGKLYFADLTGGAAACLLSLAAVQYLGVINSVLLAGMLAALPALMFITGSASRRSYAVLPVVLTAATLVYSLSNEPFTIGPQELPHCETQLGAVMNYPLAKPVWFRSTWDIYSRCDMVMTNKYDLNRSIYINGGTEAVMLRYKDDPTTLDMVKDDLNFLPYLFNRNQNVLVLGAGGGLDVRLALVAGAERVTAVEINQAVINMVNEEKAYHGDIYGHPKVRLKVEDGRTFIMQDTESYDRIVLSLAYSYAFSDLSSIAQLENYLYTKEAFQKYFERLTPDGTITIFVDYPELLEKFILTALDYFNRQGISTPEAMQHITALTSTYWSGYTYALIIQKSPFTPETIQAISAKLEQGGGGIQPLHLPHHSGDNDFYRMAAGQLTPSAYISNSPNQITPSSDDNPFFLEVTMNYRHKLLFLAAVITIILLLIIIAFLGTIVKRLTGNPSPDSATGGKGLKYFILYFLTTGIGFMLVEISLTKRFSFYLGYPQLNLAVILFSVLTGCGLGAISSSSFKTPLSRRLPLICAMLAVALLSMPLTLTAFIEHTVSYSLPVRCALLVAYLLPVAFLLGMPFPLGLRELKAHLAGDISWFWGINGISSVIGSVMAVVMSMAWGFDSVFYIAATAYLTLAAATWRMQRDDRSA